MATVTMPDRGEGTIAETNDASFQALFVTYRWMSLGLAISGAVAYGTWSSSTIVNALVDTPLLACGAMIAQLGVAFVFGSVATRASTAIAAAMFFAYAALTGVTFSTLFFVCASRSIAPTFLVTAGTFGGLSVFGVQTYRDLSPMGRFGRFVLIGVIIASFVSVLLHDDVLGFIITLVGVVLFAALTAYDTQRLRNLVDPASSRATIPLVGALTLSLGFINLFLFLLRSVWSGRSSA